MSYLVLARKYRPQGFGEVLGQPQVSTVLRNALSSGRLAHAYLFTGPRGVGKTTTARILAKALNCAKGPTPDPCGECDSCREIAASSSLDVLEMDAASHTGVDNIREAVLDTVKLLPGRDKHKIFIIDEAHMLSQAAFNALLKTLEEPPAHVVFILATTEAGKVPATISSRCQRFRFAPVSPEMLSRQLKDVAAKEGIAVEPGAAELLARAAEGSLRDALGLLDQARSFCPGEVSEARLREMLGFLPKEALSGLLEALFKKDRAALSRWLTKAYEEGIEPSQILRELRSALEPYYMEALGVGAGNVKRETGAVYKESASVISYWLRRLNAALAELRSGDSPRLILELALFEALEGGLDIPGWVARLEKLERALGADEEGMGDRGEGVGKEVFKKEMPSSPSPIPHPPSPTPRSSPPAPDSASLLPRLIASLREERAGLAEILKRAELLPGEGGERSYRLLFSSSFEMEQINRNLDEIVDKMSTLLGAKPRLSLELSKPAAGAGAAPAAPVAVPPLMKEAEKIFGGRLRAQKKKETERKE